MTIRHRLHQPALDVSGRSRNGSEYGFPSLELNKIYNNTIYGENDQKEWQKQGWRERQHSPSARQNDNVFKNNIFAEPAGASRGH